jgi:hypothetical protein
MRLADLWWVCLRCYAGLAQGLHWQPRTFSGVSQRQTFTSIHGNGQASPGGQPICASSQCTHQWPSFHVAVQNEACTTQSPEYGYISQPFSSSPLSSAFTTKVTTSSGVRVGGVGLGDGVGAGDASGLAMGLGAWTASLSPVPPFPAVAMITVSVTASTMTTATTPRNGPFRFQGRFQIALSQPTLPYLASPSWRDCAPGRAWCQRERGWPGKGRRLGRADEAQRADGVPYRLSW